MNTPRTMNIALRPTLIAARAGAPRMLHIRVSVKVISVWSELVMTTGMVRIAMSRISSAREAHSGRAGQPHGPGAARRPAHPRRREAGRSARAGRQSDARRRRRLVRALEGRLQRSAALYGKPQLRCLREQ